MLGGNSKFFWPNCFTFKQSEAYWCSFCENLDHMIFHIMGGWYYPSKRYYPNLKRNIDDGINYQPQLVERRDFIHHTWDSPNPPSCAPFRRKYRLSQAIGEGGDLHKKQFISECKSKRNWIRDYYTTYFFKRNQRIFELFFVKNGNFDIYIYIYFWAPDVVRCFPNISCRSLRNLLRSS